MPTIPNDGLDAPAQDSVILDELEALARKATPGKIFPSQPACSCATCDLARLLTQERVLALIACVKAGDAMRKQFTMRTLIAGDVPAMESFDAARAALEATP